MATEKKSANVYASPGDADASADVAALGLEEFCRRLSATDRRVELISGFFASAKLKGQTTGTEDQFKARFEAFINEPA